MELETNNYKVYYYLNNLWNKKHYDILPTPPHLIDNYSIFQNENPIKKYKFLLKLFDSEIKLNEFNVLLRNNLIFIKKLGYTKNYKKCFDPNSSKLKSEGDVTNNINVLILLLIKILNQFITL